MIRFERDGKDVVCCVESPLPHDDGNGKPGARFWFRLACEDGASAELMRRHLSERLTEAVKGMRQAEYDDGWRDAKSHKTPKRRWFWDQLLPCATYDVDNFPDPHQWNWKARR